MLKIRFFRTGRKGQPFYKLVVTHRKSAPSGGRFIEDLGHYNPLTKEYVIKEERVLDWIGKGAQCSATVHNFLIKKGVIEGKKIHVGSSKKTSEEESAKEVTPEESVKKETTEEEKEVETTEETGKTEVAPEKPEEEKDEMTKEAAEEGKTTEIEEGSANAKDVSKEEKSGSAKEEAKESASEKGDIKQEKEQDNG